MIVGEQGVTLSKAVDVVDAQSESETVDSNELAAFVDRTLKLVGGF